MNDTPAVSAASSSLAVLVVAGDDQFRSAFEAHLQANGCRAASSSDCSNGLARLAAEQFDLVVAAFDLTRGVGIDFARRCHDVTPAIRTVMLVADREHELAFDVIRAGADDVITTSQPYDAIVFAVRKIAERERLGRTAAEGHSAASVSSSRGGFANIVAASDSMQTIFETVRRLAAFNTTILITGESGTGKELIARAIHQSSPRRAKPFIAINCGAIPENLMESELFGHRRGAFTDATRDKKGLFEEATGGTIFLDEIGELPLHLQVKLLRALQEQQIRRVGDEQVIPIDVRVIAATLRDLEEDVTRGRFRDDLYYRLNVVSVHIPPLRERPDDIPSLVQHFVRKHNKRLGLNIKGITPDALNRLTKYLWRGNVRELENCIERAIVLTDSGEVDLESLPEHIRAAGGDAVVAEELPDDSNLSIKQRTRSLEISLILRALKKTGGNRTRAAKVLEISHRALLYKLKEYGLSDAEKRDTSSPEEDG